MNLEIRNDNRDQILQALNVQRIKALEECGFMAEKFASQKLTAELNASPPSSWYKRTGALRNDIGHMVLSDEKKMLVGVNIDYGKYVEFGTGIYYSGGRRTSWAYLGSDGAYHFTHGMKPRPFIKPAISDHNDDYKRIIEANLKS